MTAPKRHDLSPATARLIDTLTQRPKGAVACLALLTLFSAWWGGQIPVNGDMEALLPEDTPELLRAQNTRDTLGSRDALSILIGGPEQKANRRVAEKVARALSAQDELIERVEFERSVDVMKANALLFLPQKDLAKLDAEVRAVIAQAVKREMALDDFDEPDTSSSPPQRFPREEELLKAHGLSQLRPYQESPDGQVIAVTAYPPFKPQDIAKARALMEMVDALIAKETAGESVTSVVDGDYTGVSRSVNELSRSLATSSLLALFGVILVLWLAFRRLRAVVLVLVPLIVGLAWTASFARLTVGELNLISAFIFAILIGLGIDFAVHALSRVDAAQRGGHPLGTALKDALTRLGPAMRAAAGTTVATFASLLIFDFRGFSHFGGIAAAGVVLSLVAVYVVLPPLSVLLDSNGHEARGTKGPTSLIGEQRQRGLAIATLVLISLGTLWAGSTLSELRFDGDMRAMRIASPEETNALKRKYREEVVQRAPSPAVVLTQSLEETERVTRHLESLARDEPRLEAVTSIFSFIPTDQGQKRATIKEMRRRITQKLNTLEGQDKADAERLLPYLSPTGLTLAEQPDWVRALFTNAKGDVGHFVLLFPKGVKSRAEEVLAIQEVIGTLTIGEVTYHPTASWMFTGQAYKTVRQEGPFAVGLAALLVLFMLLADLRSISAALRAYLPLIAGVVLSLGLANQAGISLNLFNIVVLPVIFGIGVDTAIHLTHARREGLSVKEMLETTGRAAALSALTTAIGFGSLLAVPSEGLQSIGWLAVIGIGCTTACTTMGIAALATLEANLGTPKGH